MIFLTPPRQQAPHSSLVHMFDTVSRVHGGDQSIFVGTVDASGGWSLNLAQANEALRLATNQRRSVLVLGTAFSFVHLIDGLAKQRIEATLPPGSCVLETGGYKGRSRAIPKTELHALMRRYLGVKDNCIVCEYGMCELSSQAYDQVAGTRMAASPSPATEVRRFHFPAWSRVRVVSPETGRELTTGELGLIQVFDLANAWSIQAIQTDDLGRSFGTEFELVGRAVQAENRGCSLLPIELGLSRPNRHEQPA